MKKNKTNNYNNSFYHYVPNGNTNKESLDNKNNTTKNNDKNDKCANDNNNNINNDINNDNNNDKNSNNNINVNIINEAKEEYNNKIKNNENENVSDDDNEANNNDENINMEEKLFNNYLKKKSKTGYIKEDGIGTIIFKKNNEEFKFKLVKERYLGLEDFAKKEIEKNKIDLDIIDFLLLLFEFFFKY